jgi:hypothetical protein
MEPFSTALIVIFVVLLAWVGAKYYFASEDLKAFQAENRRLNDVIKTLKNGEEVLKEDEDEEDDDALPEIAVGSEVEIEIEGWAIRGKIESVAAASDDKRDLRPGFTFRAHNDENTLWLSHKYPMFVLDNEKENEETEEKPAAEVPPSESNALFPTSSSSSLFPVSNG